MIMSGANHRPLCLEVSSRKITDGCTKTRLEKV